MRAVAWVVVVGVVGVGCGDVTDLGDANHAPMFGAPVTAADHNRAYEYAIQVTDADADPVETAVDEIPSWMVFDPEAVSLTGLAGWGHLGTFPVKIHAFDGTDTTFQQFAVTVSVGEIICDQDFGDPAESEYVLPYPVGETYSVNQSYCPPDPTWGHHNWFAYDFEMPIGTEVVASRDGTVIFTQGTKTDGNRDCSTNSGNYVIVEHDDGTVIHYYHLTKNGDLAAPGDRVHQGQLIALSGDTGCSSGPHLHVSIFRGRDFTRQYTLPFNFRNASGPLDENRGLVQDASYTAEPYEASSGGE
jgi:murein DD-endopeptidase MepM/ murein hydrolase activator NlpD